MKRMLGVLAVLVAMALAVGVHADDKAMKAAPKASVVKGELVDMGCYMGHEARGEKHKGCATKCVAGGMPMGLLSADNKLYLLTLNHDNADPVNQCKDLMAAQVELTGVVSERGGMRSIDVTGVKAVATAAAK